MLNYEKKSICWVAMQINYPIKARVREKKEIRSKLWKSWKPNE